MDADLMITIVYCLEVVVFAFTMGMVVSREADKDRSASATQRLSRAVREEAETPATRRTRS